MRLSATKTKALQVAGVGQLDEIPSGRRVRDAVLLWVVADMEFRKRRAQRTRQNGTLAVVEARVGRKHAPRRPVAMGDARDAALYLVEFEGDALRR